MDDYDFPEYGKWGTLKYPYKGYIRARVIGREQYQFVVDVSSGASFTVYPDEIDFD